MRRSSLIRVDDGSPNAQDVAIIKTRVGLYIGAKAATSTGYQCLLSYTKDTKICGFNANTNHYHDSQTKYQKTMLRYHAVSCNDRQNHVRHLLDLATKQFNRTFETLKPIAFLKDSDQQESKSKNQGNCC